MTIQTAEYTRPKLYAEQEAALFAPERYSITEASTKSGKTVGALVWLTEKAMAGRTGQNFWWVAPVYPTSKIAYRRLKRMLPERVYTANETELTITLLNGAVIWFKSGEKPDNLYGEDVYAAVVDEFTRLREESWFAVRSTLTATRGDVRFIGNVKGRRNWGYILARKAEAGEPGMSYHRITWRHAVGAGVLDEAEIDSARRDLPEAVFRELYEAEASDDEGNPFGIDAIRACVRPLSKAQPQVWGWDLAKSVDWTVGVALDDEGATCGFERFQLPWETTESRILAATKGVKAIVDSTGVGDPIVERLQRSGYFQGFKFTQTSKQDLMMGLAAAIQKQEVFFPGGPIVSELESFEYEYTRTGVRYTAPEGMHDDCVMALALAVSGWRGKSWTVR